MEIVWQQIDQDDFLFREGDYLLRVEQTDNEYWWWAAFYKDDEIEFNDPQAKTLKTAQMLAESAYIKHKLRSK